jgi:serine protease
MQLKSTILVVLATFFISTFSDAQTVHPDYQDGKIYLKIKDNSDFIFRSMDEVQANKRFRDLYYIFNQYQVTKSGRPFLVLNTPIFERTYKLEFQNPSQVYDLIKELERLDYVEYAERVELLRIALTPNDPAISQNLAYHLSNIQAFDAWDIHTGGNAVVAIVDDAVRINHVDLAPNAWVNTGEIPNNGQDDDGNGYIDDINGFDVADGDNNPNPPASAADFNFSHGTHCAGIACGATNNGTGIASIGFNNKIMAVKCTRDGGDAQFVEKGYEGVAYAMASGADVISMSWGGGGSSNSAQNVFTQAHSLGITLVAAAGNDNVSTVFYPAGYNFVISVASSNQSDQKSSFSNFGSWIDITAPGSNIISTVATSSSSYESYNGTSMACPMVAGLCGLLKSYNGSLNPDEIEGCLTNGADNIDQQNPNHLSQLGAGRINAFKTLQCSTPQNPPIANFTANTQGNLCLGETVQFTDFSAYSPTSWNWSFPGGTPSSSNAQNPTVTYNTVGNHNVSLTVSNQFGSDSEILNEYISIDISGQETFFLEDFENQATGWTLNNPDGNITWGFSEVGGTEGGATAVGINNFNYDAAGQRDALFSPLLDFGGRTNVVLDFDHAYIRYKEEGGQQASAGDSLVIYISSDGGGTFSRIFQDTENGSGNFATNYSDHLLFTPSSVEDWCFGGQIGASCKTIDLSAYDGMPNIMLAFENVTAYGNNLYLDNISLISSCFVETGAPTSDFLADINTGCEGTTIQFTDASYGNPNPTSWNWSFPGGTPNSSTAQNPSVTYNTEGVYNVTLTTSNGGASSNETLTNYVNINNNATHDFYVEGFENENHGWTVNNPDNGMTWERVETGGTQSGDFAYFLYHYEYETLGEIDQLVSPTLNFSNRANVSLELDYAYAKYDNNYTDEFKVYVSSNGGNSYNLVFSGSENGSGNFATREATTTNFVPSQASDWCYAGNFGAGCLSIDLSDYDDLSNIKIRLETVNGYSNNMYVDNVRLTSGCENFSANEELESITDWNIFPNPNDGQFTLSMNNDKAANYRIQILDVLGKLVVEKEISTAGASSQTQFDLSQFPSGTYLVKLSDGVNSEVRKIVIQ